MIKISNMQILQNIQYADSLPICQLIYFTSFQVKVVTVANWDGNFHNISWTMKL